MNLPDSIPRQQPKLGPAVLQNRQRKGFFQLRRELPGGCDGAPGLALPPTGGLGKDMLKQ